MVARPSGWKCPDCPFCGHPPIMGVGEHQVFCGNDECRALMWDPTKTQAENMAGLNEVTLDADPGAPA